MMFISSDAHSWSHLEEVFQDEYEVVDWQIGTGVIDYIEQNLQEIRFVLVDADDAIEDAFDMFEKMKQNNWLIRIPTILCTAHAEDIMSKAFKIGLSDVVPKPFEEDVLEVRVRSMLCFFQEEQKYEHLTRVQAERLEEQYNQLKEHQALLIQLLDEILEFRKPESDYHIECIEKYTRILATHYAKLYPRARMTEDKINMIARASRLHDIGKIIMPNSLLQKHGDLSKEDMHYLSGHTITGAKLMQLISDVDNEAYKRISRNVCLYHHEKYDGSGYPYGVRGDKIPVEAQLVALADIYDALRHVGKEQERFSAQQAYDMLLEGKCGVLSPRMLACLQDAKEELEDNE